MKKKKYQIDLTNGPLFRKILLFSIPLLFTNLLQLTFHIADMVVVGKFASANALAPLVSFGKFWALRRDISTFAEARKEKRRKETTARQSTRRALRVLIGVSAFLFSLFLMHSPYYSSVYRSALILPYEAALFLSVRIRL